MNEKLEIKKVGEKNLDSEISIEEKIKAEVKKQILQIKSKNKQKSYGYIG